MLSGVLRSIQSMVLCVVRSVIFGTILLVKLSRIGLMGHILHMILSLILFNGNSLTMINLFGSIFLDDRGSVMGLVRMSCGILGQIGSMALLRESFLCFWYCFGLEKIFGSTYGFVVLLLDIDALFDDIGDLLLLSLWCLFNSFYKRLLSAEVYLVGILGWLERLSSHNFLLF